MAAGEGGGLLFLLRNATLPSRSGALSKKRRGRGAAERGHRGAIKRNQEEMMSAAFFFFATVDNPPFVDLMSIG